MSLKQLLGKKSALHKMMVRAQRCNDCTDAVKEKAKQQLMAAITDMHLPCAVFIFDYKNMEYHYMSDNIEHLTGFPSEHYYLKGKEHHLQQMHGDDRRLYANDVTKIFLKKISQGTMTALSSQRFTVSYRYCRADGKYIHLLQQYKVVLRSVTGVPVLVAGFLADISCLKTDAAMVVDISAYNKKKTIFSGSTFKLKSGHKSKLSPRQLEVLMLALKGKSNIAIGDELGISPHTVKTHRNRILEKTKAENINEAAHRAGVI